MEQFTRQLIIWYHQNYRELPWRSTKDPYKIWISEVILQQTRVNQGLDYYNRFIERWPTVTDLAIASEQEVLKMWQGLGYYSRARNLLCTAVILKNQYNGLFPDSALRLRKLKGIGPYTAAAIASNAFDEKVAVVDGNVMRFVARLQGILFATDTNACKNAVQMAVDAFIDEEKPGIFNQAMMEFGALHCTPARPQCNHCPFSSQCFAFQHAMVDQLPVKKQKIIVRTRYFNYLYISVKNNNMDAIYLGERTKKDIWKGLYEFPLIETQSEYDFDSICQTVEFKNLLLEEHFELSSVSKIIKHQLTHQTIFAKFFVIKLKKRLPLLQISLPLVNKSDLPKYPLSRLIDRFLREIDIL